MSRCRPAAAQEFHVRLFDANGNFIKESAAEWSLPTPPKTPAGLQPPPLKAEVKDGKLTVAKELPGQQGYLQAKVGDLTGQARIRVAPTVGYSQDFEKSQSALCRAGGSTPRANIKSSKWAAVKCCGRTAKAPFRRSHELMPTSHCRSCTITRSKSMQPGSSKAPIFPISASSIAGTRCK